MLRLIPIIRPFHLYLNQPRQLASLHKTQRVKRTISVQNSAEKAILAGFERRRGTASAAASESFRELAELAASAGAQIAGESFQVRPTPDAATLLGEGK